MTTDTQNSTVTWKWLVGILFTVVFAMAAAWSSSLSNRVSANENTDVEQAKLLSSLTENYKNVDRRLENIEKSQLEILKRLR